MFEETVGSDETFATSSGLSVEVTLGIEWESNLLIQKSTKSFEISTGYSYTKDYSKTTSSSKTESFDIEVEKGTRAEVLFFKNERQHVVKWCANFFADGDVLVECGGTKATVHLAELLT